jgi:hypothetical protein
MRRLTVFFLVCIGCGDDSLSGDASVPDATSTDALIAPADAVVTTDAGPVERCTPGETRSVDCELCGSAPQACDDTGLWLPAGECFDQGICEDGEVETEELAMCETRSRLCNATCEWGDWNAGDPAGECEAGEMRPGECSPSDTATQLCGATCEWEPQTECISSCAGDRRASPATAEELCIPAGPYIRGSAEMSPNNVHDQQEVLVSAFFIDRFPVTNARYLECVEAGACVEQSYDSLAFLRDPERTNYPFMGAHRSDAWAFCGWDGGRRLATNYEWGKAARGPAPRTNEYVWDDGDQPSCTDLPVDECDPSYQDRPQSGFNFAVDELPATASYYGVELLVAGGLEHILNTTLRREVVADDANFSPEQILTGGFFRGSPLLADLPFTLMRIGYTTGTTGEFLVRVPRNVWTFRCARSDDGAERSWETDLPGRE